jgi:uncharacterized membrane protein
MYLPLVVLMYFIIFLLEGLPLLKDKQKGSLILYFTIFIISFSLMSMITLGVEVPSPSEPIKKVVFILLGKKAGS